MSDENSNPQGQQQQVAALDINNPEIKAQLDAYVDQQVQGLKAKNSELIQSNKGLKDELGTFKSQFEGLDIGAVKGLLNKASQDEETRLLAEGKIDEVLNRKTELLRQDMNKQLDAEKQAREKAESFAGKFRDKVLADSIRSAAIKAGAIPEAMEDIILRSRGVFTLNEDGEAVAVDKDGSVILGKDGKTPLSPQEWAEGLREKASHLWPKAQGAGAQGANGTGGKSTMTRTQFDSLNPTEKQNFIRKGGQLTD